MKKKIFLHIGLYKTGSTFLQENIFKEIKKDDYKIFLKYYNSYIYNELFKINHLNRDIKSLKKYLSELKENNLIISNEGLFGNFFDGFKENKKRMENYEKIFNNPIYIIFIREQSELLFSFYKERIKHGLKVNFNNFLSSESINLESKKINPQKIDYKSFDYNIILKDYLKLPKDRVFIFTFEDFFLKNKTDEFFNLLNLKKKDYSNARRNTSIPNIEYFFLLNQNLLFKIFKIIIFKYYNLINKFKKNKINFFDSKIMSLLIFVSIKLFKLFDNKIIDKEKDEIIKLKKKIKMHYQKLNGEFFNHL